MREARRTGSYRAIPPSPRDARFATTTPPDTTPARLGRIGVAELATTGTPKTRHGLRRKATPPSAPTIDRDLRRRRAHRRRRGTRSRVTTEESPPCDDHAAPPPQRTAESMQRTARLVTASRFPCSKSRDSSLAAVP